MVIIETNVKKFGNSLGLIIPRDIVRIENIKEGDKINFEIVKEKRLGGFGMFKGMKSFKREIEDHEDLW